MIHLLEPPAAVRVSGGYRYNAEIGARLAGSGSGRRLAVAPEHLPDRLAELAVARDVVVLDGLYLTLLGAPAWLPRLRGDVRLLLHLCPSHDPWLPAPERAAWTAIERAWTSRVQGVIVTSPHAGVPAGAREVHVAHPGVDECFLARPGRAPASTATTVVCVANLLPRKGQLGLAQALTALVDRVPRFRLVLLGDDQVDAAYTAAVRAAPRGFELLVAGAVPVVEVARWLHASDLYVAASCYESCGMATLEAAAAGIPILATRAGAAELWVREAESGWLVEAGDERALQARLAQLLSDPEELARHRGRSDAAWPTWEQACASFVEACTCPRRIEERPPLP